MARYVTSLIINRTPAQTFEFISDFRNAPSWDPQTVAADKVTEGPIGVGTRFVLVGKVWGRTMNLPYEIVGFEPPYELSLRGESANMRYFDHIQFTAEGTGTKLSYDARLNFKGILVIGEPILKSVFQRIGDKATRGMPKAIEDGTPAVPPPA